MFDGFSDFEVIRFLFSDVLSRTVRVMGAEMSSGEPGVKVVLGMVKVPLLGELNR